MFTFYSKKKLQQAVETGVKRIDDALAIGDPTRRAEALLAAQEETSKSRADLDDSVAIKTLLSMVGSMALAVTGLFCVFSALPALVTAGMVAVPFFGVTIFASMFKSTIDNSVVYEKINPLREKIETEISTIFTQDQESFMKTSVGKELSEKFQKDLAKKFDMAGSKKNKTNEEYAQLKQKIGNPAPKV
jgi:hypothetical protein